MTSPSPARQGPAQPVALVTDDPSLAQAVQALSGAAGVAVQVVPQVSGAAAVRLVLIGADRVAELAAEGGGAGGGEGARGAVEVVVVCRGRPPEEVWPAALALGARHVVELPTGESWLLDRLLDAGSAPATGRVVAVIGGRGGAGATTLATALAVSAARAGAGVPTLIDLDPLGAGLDLLLGAESEPGLRWEDLAGARGRLQPGLIADGLPRACGLRFLTWGRRRGDCPAGAAGAVLDAARREGPLVVLDLPRRLGAVTELALGAVDDLVLVVPAEIRATAAASHLLSFVSPRVGAVRLVVRGPAPSGLSARAVADALELPLAGVLRPEPGLAGDLDRGVAPPVRHRGPLATLCRRLLEEVA